MESSVTEQGHAGLNIQRIEEHLPEERNTVTPSSPSGLVAGPASPTSPRSQWSRGSTILGGSDSASPTHDVEDKQKASRFASWASVWVNHMHRRCHGLRRYASSSSRPILPVAEKAKQEPAVVEVEIHADQRVVRQIHKQPKGYPKLATYLDSDENFMMYRRFGFLQSRLLLEKQDDLRRLETRLDMMEKAEHKKRVRAADSVRHKGS